MSRDARHGIRFNPQRIVGFISGGCGGVERCGAAGGARRLATAHLQCVTARRRAERRRAPRRCRCPTSAHGLPSDFTEHCPLPAACCQRQRQRLTYMTRYCISLYPTRNIPLYLKCFIFYHVSYYESKKIDERSIFNINEKCTVMRKHST